MKRNYLKKLIVGAGISALTFLPFSSNAQRKPARQWGDYYITIGAYSIKEKRWNMFIEGVKKPSELELDSMVYDAKITRYTEGWPRRILYKGAKISIIDTLGLDFGFEVALYYAKVKIIENYKKDNKNQNGTPDKTKTSNARKD